MIGDDAKSDVDLFLLVFDFVGRLCQPPSSQQRRPTVGSVLAYFFAAQFFDLIENRAEDVGLVIRNRAGKIGEIPGALNDCDGALETHSGIDVALRQTA